MTRPGAAAPPAAAPGGGQALEQLALSRGVLDRASDRRDDAAWIGRAWAHPASCVLVIADGEAPVRDQESGSPALHLVASAEAPPGERYFLGLDPAGTAYFAVRADSLPAADGVQPAGLREVGAALDDRDAGMLVHAVALANWHTAHRHCSRCGAPTSPSAAGHLRRCSADASEHYPRTDPAVIMTVLDDADRVLLGRQPHWPERRFSALAGFVEPGESLEQAVRREVLEEAGVLVSDVSYLGSQPWPFPSSLMLAFTATATSTAITVDGEELAEAAWFSREVLGPAVATGEVQLPPPVSIARRMIEHWYGAAL